MVSVSVSDYWFEWMKSILQTNIRKSKSEIVEEGLKSIQYKLDFEAERMRAALREVSESERQTS